jgi:Mce-associated membrane protein
MADDAAAPEGELTEPSPESPGADDTDAGDAASNESVEESDDATSDDETDAPTDDGDTAEAPTKQRMSHVRLATIAGLVLVVTLGGLTGWLGYRAYESRKAEDLHNLFLQVGRQGALNLTTIDWEHAEADVQRVLDSSTGTFYDDFQKRAAPFAEVVKQAKSKSTGTVSEAGVESQSDNEARVLVAVTINTSNAGTPEQQPKSWRMRISVQKTGEDEAKVSNVEFVP